MRMRTLNEAAEALGTTRHRLKQGIDGGKYPAMRWGSRVLVDLDAIGPIIAAEDAEAERLVGIGEISEMTGLPVTTIRKMCREGVLPFERDKRTRYRFRPSEVMAAIENMME